MNSRLITSDSGRTYTWVGLTRADVLALQSILVDGTALFNTSATGAMATMGGGDEEAIDDLMVSATCAGVADRGFALLRAIQNPVEP